MTPNEWHRRPADDKKHGRCSICNCPARCRGEHRTETAGETWTSRRKTKHGWKYTGYAKLAPPKRSRGISKRLQERIARAATMAAQGRQCKQIAEVFGVRELAVTRWKREYSVLWGQAYDKVLQDVVAVVRAEVGTDAILADPDRYLRYAVAAGCNTR